VDLSALASKEYSGRGITIGMTESGIPFVTYTLTGRSSSSQARVLEQEAKGVISTKPTDEKVLNKGNRNLLIYKAIVPIQNGIVVSNGAQTDMVVDAFRRVDKRNNASSSVPEKVLTKAFSSPTYVAGIDVTAYEPDPHSTPRITGVLYGNECSFAICRKIERRNNITFWSGTLERGKGYLMTTYEGGNESPVVLSFVGDAPLEMRIGMDTVEDINEAFKGAIASGNYDVGCVTLFKNYDGQPPKQVVNSLFNKVESR